MNRLVIAGKGCVREKTLELRFLDDIMVGSIIHDQPKRLVHKSKFNRKVTYIY